MTEVRYLPRAENDVLGAVEFYESRAAGLGAEFLSSLEHTIDSIIASPHADLPTRVAREGSSSVVSRSTRTSQRQEWPKTKV